MLIIIDMTGENENLEEKDQEKNMDDNNSKKDFFEKNMLILPQLQIIEAF